jgi:hypothetical protein
LTARHGLVDDLLVSSDTSWDLVQRSLVALLVTLGVTFTHVNAALTATSPYFAPPRLHKNR